jgi:hypothetical protein
MADSTRPTLDIRQWTYGKWWTAPKPGEGPVPLDPQPPAPPQDAQGNAIGLPEGWR